MRPKTISHVVIFVFLIITACSGKNQLIRNNGPEAHASSEVETNPSENPSTPVVKETKGTVSIPLAHVEKSQPDNTEKTSPKNSNVSKKETRKSGQVTLNPQLPSLTTTATVSTTAPIAEESSLPPAVKGTPAQKALSP